MKKVKAYQEVNLLQKVNKKKVKEKQLKRIKLKENQKYRQYD